MHAHTLSKNNLQFISDLHVPKSYKLLRAITSDCVNLCKIEKGSLFTHFCSKKTHISWGKIVHLCTIATVAVHICTVTVAIVHKCTILPQLMWVLFEPKCVKRLPFSILHKFTQSDVIALILQSAATVLYIYIYIYMLQVLPQYKSYTNKEQYS